MNDDELMQWATPAERDLLRSLDRQRRLWTGVIWLLGFVAACWAVVIIVMIVRAWVG